MLEVLKKRLKVSLEKSLKDFYPNRNEIPPIEIEVPKDKTHGDFALNIALKSVKILKKNPIAIAEDMAKLFRGALIQDNLMHNFDAIEVVKPGFINFRLSRKAIYEILYDVFEKKDAYGSSQIGKGQKLQIEFVSANPTGPLSVAHARQAAFGDALANVLKALGFDVVKEYYVNDEGNQIKLLGDSLCIQAQRLLSKDKKASEPQEEVHYQGDYVIEMAKIFIHDFKIDSQEKLEQHKQSGVAAGFASAYLLDVIKKELEAFHVHFDIWSFQSKIATTQEIETVFNEFKEQGYLYEKEGALWFKSTEFNDDKDRVVKKSDGTYTYLAPDIVYHKDKFKRGFNKVINIWGPDHHGYIPRLRAAVQALGQNAASLCVLIVQLATVYREGKPVSMSTRSGQYIQLQEVIDEVGVDAARFHFLMRHINAHLDFDLALAKKESPENPVFYIQYAYARIHSIFKKSQEAEFKPKSGDLKYLREVEEISIIKLLGFFPEMLLICYREMDTFSLISYLMELASAFHKFYDCHKVLDPQHVALSNERLALINAVRIVLDNGLRLLGITRPQRM